MGLTLPRERALVVGKRLKNHFRGCVDGLETQKQIKSNRKKSRVRSRVEPVSAVMSGQAGRVSLRNIGAARTKAAVVMMNLTDNLIRYEQIVRLDLMPLRA